MSFTARIDELVGYNVKLETELEQWKLAASRAEVLLRELGARLEAAQSNTNALQQ